jgi:hypothetical protein
VRYVLLLDLPIRIFAAAMVLAIPQMLVARLRAADVAQDTRNARRIGLLRWSPLPILALLVFSDVAAFERYFIAGGIYDTVSYNLLRVDHIVPTLDAPSTAAPAPNAALAAARAQVSLNPDAAHFLALSYQYCAAGLSLECSWASRDALRLAPGDAKAYNNLCVAYNGLRDWPQAIAACNEALRIDPGFQLARNNLNWAVSQSAIK